MGESKTTDLFSYLDWRGDLPFTADPVNCVDTLIFAALSYIRLDDLLVQNCREPVTLAALAEQIRAREEAEKRTHISQCLELIQRAAETKRFSGTGIGFYRSIFIPEQDTQFAALAFYPVPGQAVLAYRGTDDTMVGWKEDLNMSFQEVVPAQREALFYLEDFAREQTEEIILCGHSKGGNLAVFAGAQCAPLLQRRIKAVNNHDGPGFTGSILCSPGYLAMVPKIHTYVPQSSVIGMLLEHEEPYTVIRSSETGILQHSPFSWETMGGNFRCMEEVDSGSRFFNRAIKNWLAGMDREKRIAFVDALFDTLAAGGVARTGDLTQLRNLRNLLKVFSEDEESRKVITGELTGFFRAAQDLLFRQPEKENNSEE